MRKLAAHAFSSIAITMSQPVGSSAPDGRPAQVALAGTGSIGILDQ
jgi:hypothetical protein